MGSPTTTRTIAGLEASTFTAILLVGLVVGVGGFIWTLERTPPQAFRRSVSVLGPRDPDQGFTGRAQQMYAAGQYQALIEAGKIRRSTWPRDLTGWLLPAFAHEKLADQPGLEAFAHRASAKDLWAELLQNSRDQSVPVQNPLYYEGWALLGLGEPMMARERFARFAEQTGTGMLSASQYNRACYLALAGDLDGARTTWSRAAPRQRVSPAWAMADPDLEPLHGTLEFRAWHAFLPMHREDQARLRAERAASGEGGADPSSDAAPTGPARF